MHGLLPIVNMEEHKTSLSAFVLALAVEGVGAVLGVVVDPLAHLPGMTVAYSMIGSVTTHGMTNQTDSIILWIWIA